MTDVQFCTIVAANYLPQALRLRTTLLERYPDASFTILLVEQPDVVADLSARVDARIVGPHEVGCPTWLPMAFYYDCMEYSTALKPYLLKTLLEGGPAIYFDPDIEVLGDLSEILDAVRTNDIVLTPHLSEPLDADGKRPGLIDFIRVGQFNLGFIGVGNTECARGLMSWWGDVLVENSVSDLRRDLFTDQMWASLFASFAERCAILRSTRHNVAYWNVFQRDLHRNEDGVWTTKDGPVSFFHYSGLDPNDIGRVSRHQNRVQCEEGSDLYRILAEYAGQLAASDANSFRDAPYSFGYFRDGTPILGRHRRTFLAVNPMNRSAIEDPFASRSVIEEFVDCTPHLLSHGVDSEVERVQYLEERVHSLQEILGRPHHRLADLVDRGLERVPPLAKLVYGTERLLWKAVKRLR